MIKVGELVMILDLHRQGLSVSAIARQVRIPIQSGQGLNEAATVAELAAGLEAAGWFEVPPA